MPKKYGFRSGGWQKILGVKGGVTEKNCKTAVSVIIESLNNEGGNGIENVTQKVSSRRFKLYRSYCNSFNSSNVGVFFQELNSIKNVSTFTKRKKTFLFEFSRFFLFFFGRGGGLSQLFWEKRGAP